MLTQTRNISSHEDLVGAYEALREAVLSSGASAPASVDGRRLMWFNKDGHFDKGATIATGGVR
jgi:hypothetical protein